MWGILYISLQTVYYATHLHNMRTNVYKEKIVELFGCHHLLSIADIHTALPEADYSTIYRNVEHLLDAKQIKKVVVDTKTVVYELVHGNEHDHFVCDDCGEVEEIALARKELGIELAITGITIRGVCGNCTHL